jgi:hypothetical protein
MQKSLEQTTKLLPTNAGMNLCTTFLLRPNTTIKAQDKCSKVLLYTVAISLETFLPCQAQMEVCNPRHMRALMKRRKMGAVIIM